MRAPEVRLSQPNDPVRKTNTDGGSFLERSAKAFQENVTRAGPFAAASYTLVGAIFLLGFIGYAIDRWRNTSPGFLIAGLILALVVGFYDLAKAVWKR